MKSPPRAKPITSGNIDTDRLQANVIAAINSYAGTMKIQQGQIETLQVGNANIVDASISGAKISKATITNAQIADATIEHGKIKSLDASKVTTGTLDASKINVTNLNADSITTGSIIVEGNNELRNTNFKNGFDNWVQDSGAGMTIDTENLFENVFTVRQNTTKYLGLTSEKIDVASTHYVGSVYVKTNETYQNNNVTLFILTYDESNLQNTSLRKDISVNGNKDWHRIVYDVKLPSNAKRIAVKFRANGTFDGWFAKPMLSKGSLASVWKLHNDEMISDGAITENKIKDNAITTNKLNLEELFVSDGAFVNNLSAVEIDAGQITTGKISNERIDINGIVSFESFNDEVLEIFDTNGDKTYINGGMIATNSISADKIDIKGLTVIGPDNIPTFAVAQDGTVTVDAILKSANFDVDKNTGYKVTTDGKAIFNEAEIRGNVILPNAGITNEGTLEQNVRFWSGTSYENRENAPFRVLQNGDLIANKGTFGGTVASDEVNVGKIHMHQDAIVINSKTTKMLDNGKTITTEGRCAEENPFIELKEGQSTINTSLILGSGSNQNIIFDNKNNTFSSKDTQISFGSKSTSVKVGTSSDWAKGGLTLVNEGSKTGSELNIFHYNRDKWTDTCIIMSKGGKGTTGDINIRRELLADDVDVVVQGTVAVRTALKGQTNNMEMRTTQDGFAFYAM